MSDDLRRKLEQRVDRRSFLRGSSFLAAALLGAAAFPKGTAAQTAQSPEQKPDEKPDEKPDSKDDKKETTEAGKDGDAEPDPFKVTKKDAQGRDYRMCPQCGYNMYQQDRTWTCENCGYSYIE